MQWLNALDDVLEHGFRRGKTPEEASAAASAGRPNNGIDHNPPQQGQLRTDQISHDPSSSSYDDEEEDGDTLRGFRTPRVLTTPRPPFRGAGEVIMAAPTVTAAPTTTTPATSASSSFATPFETQLKEDSPVNWSERSIIQQEGDSHANFQDESLSVNEPSSEENSGLLAIDPIDQTERDPPSSSITVSIPALNSGTKRKEGTPRALPGKLRAAPRIPPTTGDNTQNVNRKLFSSSLQRDSATIITEDGDLSPRPRSVSESTQKIENRVVASEINNERTATPPNDTQKDITVVDVKKRVIIGDLVSASAQSPNHPSESAPVIPKQEIASSLPTHDLEADHNSEQDKDSSLVVSFPQQIEYKSDFDVDQIGWGGGESASDVKNQFGAVHVRLVNARQLACPIGSSVQAVISLLPWRGKVRTPSVRSFGGVTKEAGVCVQWEDDDMVEPISLMHPFSGEESPIPTIRIELVFRPLGMFAVTLCSFEIHCLELFLEPMVPRRGWFSCEHTSNPEFETLLQLEAMFEVVSSDGNVATVGDNDSIVSEPKVSSGFPSKHHSELDERSASLDTVSFSLTSRRSDLKAIATKRHLLGRKKFFTPASCAICGGNLMTTIGKSKAYRCRECKLDCCEDCTLVVDVRLPCGSDEAKDVVSRSIQSLLSPSNILQKVAPLEDNTQSKTKKELSSGSVADKTAFTEGNPHRNTDVGLLHLRLLGGLVFSEGILFGHEPAEELERRALHLRRGQYYINIRTSQNKASARTPTIQSEGRPSFASFGEMTIPCSDFGTEFCFELVDASAGSVIGVAILTAQSFLQKQREFTLQQNWMDFFPRRPKRFSRMLDWSLEFREGVSENDYFLSPFSVQTPDKGVGKVRATVQMEAALVENTTELYSIDRAISCPSRKEDDFNLALIQVHIARISNLVSQGRIAVDMYLFIIGWKNPVLTGFSFVTVIAFWVYLDPRYFLHVPFFFLLLVLLGQRIRRVFWTPKDAFLLSELRTIKRADKVSVDYSIHRPFGLLEISVLRGRNMRSPELGLPGNVGCKISWDSSRFEKRGTKGTKVSLESFEIASTQFLPGMNPDWKLLNETPVVKRLKRLVPRGDSYFEESRDQSDGWKEVVELPLLQPLRTIGSDYHALDPWILSRGALSIKVLFQDIISLMPGSEYELGEILVPFSTIIEKGSISQWYTLSSVDTDKSKDSDSQRAELYVETRWRPPESLGLGSLPQECVREVSVAMQEELVRESILKEAEKRSNLFGNSFSAVRDLGSNLKMIQNTLGEVLDYIEAGKNLLSFTDPQKSAFLLAVAFLCWIVLVILPSKLIVLIVILAQYAVTFLNRYSVQRVSRKVDKTTLHQKDIKLESPGPSLGAVLGNFWKSLPTDEDLRRSFLWETRHQVVKAQSLNADQKRNNRMKKLWRAQWYSNVQLLQAADDSHEEYVLRPVFAVIVGHRFMWWNSARDFDQGDQPLGRLFLSGHAGIATPSPLEMKLFDADEVPRIVCLIGRGGQEQTRVTMLAPDLPSKNDFELAVTESLEQKMD